MIVSPRMGFLLAALICAVVVMAGNQPAMAVNVLANPGFEDGVTIYSGDGVGGGKGWSYVMLAGNNAIRPETYYANDQFPPAFHGGAEALRFRTSYEGPPNGESYIYQEVAAWPNAQYTASVWVKTHGPSSFGVPGDMAGIIVQEFDSGGNYIGNITEAYITTPSEDYVQLTTETFTTGSSTKMLRFVLHTSIAANYQRAAIAYDDCVLDGPAVPASLSGIVTSNGSPVAGATVESQGQTATTAANGSYSLSGLLAQASSVTVSKDGYWPASQTANLNSGANTLNVSLIKKPANNLLMNGDFESGVTIYSGTGSGGGNGWSYKILYDSCAIRPETYYAGDQFPPQFHSGAEALRFRTSTQGPPGGESIIWQDAQVMPSSNYVAQVFVRGYGGGVGGYGFGMDPADKAGVWIKEFDQNGNEVRDNGEAVITAQNSDYELVTLPFTTTATTTKVRFILHSVISANFQSGAIAYDDCALEGPPVTGTLSGVVRDYTGSFLGGVTVAAQGKTAVTGSNGAYTIPDLIAGAATVTFEKDGYWGEMREVDLARGETTLNVVMAPQAATNLLLNAGFEEGVVAYSGTESGGGLNWTHQMLQGDNAARAESYYTGLDPYDIFSREYHSGNEAIRFRGSGNTSEGISYQDVPVLPNTQYTASAWVRGYDEGTGFGRTAGDKAGIWVKTLDAAGNELQDYGEAVIQVGNTRYQYVAKTFTTGASAAKVRFMLHTVIGADYLNGAVAYDDCALDGPGVPATVQGTVTTMGAPLQGATVSVLGQTALTNANGFYSITAPLTNQRLMQVSRANFWPASFTPDLVPGTNVVPDVDLKPMVVNNLLANPGFEEGVKNNNTPGTYQSYGWTYVIEDNGVPGGGTPAVRAETYYAGDQFRPQFHSGAQAIRFRCSSGGGWIDIFQDVGVQAGGEYTASAWVRAYSNGSGFGTDPNDRAGVRVYALDSGGNVVEPAIAESLISQANTGYEYLQTVFTVPAGVARVRYALHVNTLSDYSNGAVTFDDTGLEAAVSYTQVTSVAGLKALADETPVSISGKVVTAAFDGFFYIEEQDRSSGIKVTGAAVAGYTASISGRIRTIDGERTLVSDSVTTAAGGTIPGALGLNNRAALGMVPVGLYVRVWGMIDSVDAEAGSFTITDGSGSSLKINGAPGVSGFVTVTGALGAELADGQPSAVVHAVSVTKLD